MNYKKIVATLAALLLLGASAFAEINLKDTGGGKVEITFLFKDSSSEMGVIGSFDNWTAPGEPMTKNADGLWEKTISALVTDEIVYKFYTKGTYIFDEMAPDKKDDGFGGFNGLIVVADILSGVTPMKPGAAPVAVKVVKVPGAREKLYFGTETYLEVDSAFGTKGGLEPKNILLNAQSKWKFEGDLIPNLPGHLEITVFDGHQPLAANASQDSLGDGLQNLGAGVLFNPVNYLSGGKNPVLNKFAFGIDGPWLEYETGYLNSTLPAHKGILWDTVSKENKANDGYSSFRLGNKARTLGDVTFDAAVVPNKSQDQTFGLYSFASVEAYGARIEVQYDLKANNKDTLPREYFKNAARQDLILGAEYFFDDYLIQGQGLLSRFLAGGSFDNRPVAERAASQLVAGYRDVYGSTEALFGYAYRGGNFSTTTPQITSSLLYAKNDDVLGALGTQKFSFTGFQKYEYWGTAKLDAAFTTPASGNPDKNDVVTVKPGFVLNLDALNVYPVTFDVYTQVKYNTKPASGIEALFVNTAGAKAAFAAIDAYYKFDNTDPDVLFNTLLTEARFGDLTAHGGVGLRTGKKAENALGLVLGAKYVVPAPEAKSPTVYVQFVYNMDPYDSSMDPYADLNPSSFNLTDDFGPEDGAQVSDGLGAFRAGISWNY